jgi:uncharacterized membrane protein YfcA
VFAYATWRISVARHYGDAANERWRPGLIELAVGFISDFLDTLGIGSFAVTTTLFRFARVLPDRLLPGTLNVGHALPTVLQALIYISVIEIDVTTLVSMVAAAMFGAYLGAGFVARLSERAVRLGMGIALAVAAVLMLARMRNLMPAGRDDLALTGVRLIIGLVGNAIFGALMTLGIGLYAPCMLLVAALGMSPKAAFPIMMGSCAFLMLVAAPRFVRERGYQLRAALGLTLGGLPGVWIAAQLVKQLELTTLRWLVLAVVGYTSVALLRAAMRDGAKRVDRV